MREFLVVLLIIFNLSPAFAVKYVTTTRPSPYYNSSRHCPTCHSNNYYTTTNPYRNYNRYNYNNNYRNVPPPPQRYYRHNPYYRNTVPVGNLNALERYALNKSYRRESDIQRLERLENLAFGATQAGDLDTRYQNVENAILSRPQNNYKRSVLGNIANYFAGQPTGFTPSIMTQDLSAFPNYVPTPGYNTRRIDQFSNGIFGNGYNILDQNFTNGSSIRMLD